MRWFARRTASPLSLPTQLAARYPARPRKGRRRAARVRLARELAAPDLVPPGAWSSRQGGKGLERELVLREKPTHRGGIQPPPEFGPGPARHQHHHGTGREGGKPLGDREPVEIRKHHVEQ